MKSLVSEKGQVTIPKALRDRLGLRSGTVLDFQAEAGKLVATKAVAADVFNKWRGRGRLPAGLSVDEYLKRVRDGRANRG
jgi:AbrB family looped-hinge helix DNA binding protein